MKKMIKTLLVITLMVGVIFPSHILNGMAENIYVEHVYEEIDWSSIGFENVKIIYRDNISRGYSDVPTVEIDLVFAESGRTGHYERIGNVGYHYIEGELITETVYTNSNSRLGITIPSDYLNYNEIPATGFSIYRASGYYHYVIQDLRDYVINSLVEEAVFLMLSGLTGVLPGFLYLSSRRLLDTVQFTYSYLTSVSNVHDLFDGLDYHEIAVIYQSYHGQCNILAWYGYNGFLVNPDTNTAYDIGKSFVPAEQHSWNGTPHDYSQPAACRVLEAGDYEY